MTHARGVLGAALGAVVLGVALTPVSGQRGAPAVPAPLSPLLRDYQPVTDERLKSPEDQNWLMIRRTYDGWGFSPLTQITPANVSRLRPVWVFSTAEARVHQAAPLVNGGVMFVTSPNNQVIAIDVKSGNLLWRYRRPRTPAMSVPHETNRGVALYDDKVYFAAGEAVLVALDVRTGREVWTTVVADNAAGYYTTLAPVVAGDVVMVGASGGEFGIRGFVNNNLCGSNMGVQTQYTPGRAFVGISGSRPFIRPGADHVGEVQAWNVDTGQKIWTHEYKRSPNWGGMLATAGGLVFTGGTSDRKFHAFDATTGKLLWEFPMNSGALAPPSSFSIDGKQYVAVESGWGGDSRGMQATLNNLFPGEYPEVPEGGAVWVFALE